MFGSTKFTKLVLQAEAAECGLACIAMICSYHGRAESLTELRRRFPISLTGLSLKSVIAIFDNLGFSARPVRCDLEELGQLQLPCVLHWNLDHYVVLTKVTRREVVVLDPAQGERRLLMAEVSHHFTGVALELLATPRFEKKKTTEKVHLYDLWDRMSGYLPLLLQLFALTLMLQIFGLLMPVASQIVVDDVIGHGDTQLLLGIIVGFGVIALLQAGLDLLRNYIQLHASQKLSLQLAGNLLNHLLRLPADFFERRHVGDVVTRFGSLTPVQNFLTGGIVGITLDGLMLIPCGVIMILYSPLLSALVALDVAIAFVVQLLSFGTSRRYADQVLTLNAALQSTFLETIRAIRTIKLFGRENERHSVWQNAMVDVQNLSFRQSCFEAWGGSGYGLLMTVQGLIMLYLGALQIMAGHLSLGMFVAFGAYAGQFSMRSKSLIGQWFTFKMLGLHLERLADIIHTDTEAPGNSPGLPGRRLKGEIQVTNLDFQYAPQNAWVLKGVNFHIRPGERIAFTGPSGGGKSTLLKLLTGLYAPSGGEILIDGLPLRVIGPNALREQIGVVMQDDQLLSGTIADNISFFDTQFDMARVEEMCRLACVHDDIMRLPMGYHSLIGDMGSILSGGQKQRILLARALYRNPSVLFMDEGTANLDIGLETTILENLKKMGITQIMVAHREGAIGFAERVFRIQETRLTELSADNDVMEAAQ